MSGGIYLIHENNQLVEMTEQPYPTEDLLQELLEKYPNLLAGDQIDSAVPRRWRLVSREMAVPDEENGAGRWALDHLFLDQDGIPTLVEVKRSSDTRIRREVIGQRLDYAANAVVHWPVEIIRTPLVEALVQAILALSPEERALLEEKLDCKTNWRETLERIDKLQAKIHDRRGGKPFDPPLEEYIHQTSSFNFSK